MAVFCKNKNEPCGSAKSWVINYLEVDQILKKSAPFD
jgi:hypothetical protein